MSRVGIAHLNPIINRLICVGLDFVPAGAERASTQPTDCFHYQLSIDHASLK
ncbi:hypothetical protein PCC7424_0413 [Gloeothece citriformis PCC 7424]|uniref:Uncharacterized protein n=1 Tax=Gloeothece citriformis (strain PCC 7424) TaxID=65393 RepID=B7KC56_GLOC7|nr:hypothetical protein PCC7424_0413 [Gloeothece citriformis PCC 7424]